jgi:hypothetical protein
MHKGWAYQIYNFGCLRKNYKSTTQLWEQNQHEQNIKKKKKLVGGIEPQFYEELCSIVAQVPYPNHAPHKITQPHIQHQIINFYHHLYATT